MIAVLSLAVIMAVTMLHKIINAVPVSDTGVADVLQAVTTNARTAAAYDGSPGTLRSTTWTLDSATFVAGCTGSTPTCAQVTTSISGSNLTVSVQNLTTNETQTALVPLHQEAADPTVQITPPPP